MSPSSQYTRSSNSRRPSSTSAEDHHDDSIKDSCQQMLQMTMELVEDICLNVRKGHRVLTTYGAGEVVSYSPGSDKASHSTVVIKLDWGGKLHCPSAEFVHKCLTPEDYEMALEHLEQVRKMHVCIQCHDWGICYEQQPPEGCVACLFHKPELYSSSKRRGFFASSNAKSKVKTQRCDVCGNPVCAQHKIAMNDGGDGVEFFVMCVDCSHDLNQTSNNKQFHANHSHLVQNLQRLSLYYTRMILQLCFCVPNLPTLSYQLTHKQKRDGAISLGNSALGFVGAALGVAGAAAMLTPAGPAILLAAVATSATSGTFQFSHQTYNKYLSNQTARQLADRCLGWHGLSLGIMNALESLRQDLIVQEHDFVQDHGGPSSSNKKSTKASQLTSTAAPSQHSTEIWNSLAVGSFTTTRSAMTGIGVTSSLGASYSQAFNTSLQGIPVVGAAFAVGCMAMDANNMASSFKMLNTPAKKAIALQGVEQSFAKHMMNSIRPSVDVILEAIEDLQERMAEQQRGEEAALIEAELEGLGGVDNDGGIEKELANL